MSILKKEVQVLMKKILLSLFFVFLSHCSNFDVHFIIFSFDRPIQLYSLLESSYKYISHLSNISVICRVSDNYFKEAYQSIEGFYKGVNFFYQQDNQGKDFQKIFNKVLNFRKSDYICFGVDDIIVKDYFDFSYCAFLLKKHPNIYGVFLRLGKNILYSYSENKILSLPKMRTNENLCIWKFADGQADWRYPNNVDMTVYRKQDIINQIQSISFDNPNQMEGSWALLANNNKLGICFDHSKILNIPINLVNQTHSNRNMSLFTCKDLLNKFNDGFKIDIMKFFRIENKSPHIEYKVNFIKR